MYHFPLLKRHGAIEKAFYISNSLRRGAVKGGDVVVFVPAVIVKPPPRSSEGAIAKKSKDY